MAYALLDTTGPRTAQVPDTLSAPVQTRPEQSREPQKTPSPPENRIDLTVATGETFTGILKEHGISLQQALDIQVAVQEIFNLSRLTAGNRLTLVFSGDNQTLLGLEYEADDLSSLTVNIRGDKIEAGIQQVEKIVKPKVADALREMDVEVRKGDNIFGILKGCGIDAGQIHTLFKSVKREYNLADITPGHPLKIWVSRSSPVKLAKLTYDIEPAKYLEVIPGGAAFRAKTHTRTMDISYERSHGTVRSSLYESAVMAGLQPEIVMDLTDIFGWDINFFTDLHEGDTFTVLYERYSVGGEPRGCGRVVAARFMLRGEEHLALYYKDGKGNEGYYDEHGKPIRKLFLKAPLNYRRISSGFSRSRIHPVFHVKRPHLGVDYAAPTGTPVVALGQGRITRCGWARGFGRTITIKHPCGYVTNYGHLSRIAKGMAKGSRVDQGDVIGYVGATGIATGPHLDFRVQRQGKYINPLRLEPVNGPRLGGKALARFREVSLQRLTMLDDVSLDRTHRVSSLN